MVEIRNTKIYKRKTDKMVTTKNFLKKRTDNIHAKQKIQ